MINHRILKALISQQPLPACPNESLTEALSLSRRSNRMAERDIADWLYARFLSPDVANKTVFDAEVMDVMRSGLKVRLLANGAVCFIPADGKDRNVQKVLVVARIFVCNVFIIFQHK